MSERTDHLRKGILPRLDDLETEVRKIWQHLETAHPEVSEQSSQDQPNPFWPIFKETLLALKLAHTALTSKGYADYASLEPQIALAISKADTFLADPQQIERDAAGCLVGGCLELPVSGNRLCPGHQDVLGIREDSNA